jgi:hypothetical protein
MMDVCVFSPAESALTFDKLTVIEIRIKNEYHEYCPNASANLFNFHTSCLVLSANALFWHSPKFAALLAGLDQNAQGNAGA